eukprot:Selendium_serpulae@DN5828_c0_g1_i2.p1
MPTVLLLNGSQVFAFAEGKLNNLLQKTAADTFSAAGWKVLETTINEKAEYKTEEEIAKVNEADLVILQVPIWWMGLPWMVKKYIDEVFTPGHSVLFKDDGRTRSDPSKKYGSGGLQQGTKYMLSLTTNCPAAAYTDKDDFFGGVGVDAAYVGCHKIFQFMGMSSLPTFHASDVVKVPQAENFAKQYKEHLEKQIPSFKGVATANASPPKKAVGA